jgi:uncharacterized cupin superfamily protein
MPNASHHLHNVEIFVHSRLIMTLNHPLGALVLAGFGYLISSPTLAQAVHPTKISGNNASAKTAPDVHQTDQTYKDFKWRIMGTSADKNYRSGLSWTTKRVSDVDEPNTVDEFIFIVKGRERYTSSDGTVIEVNAGDGIFVPKGWRGRWESDGPVEFFFAVYDPDKLYEERSRQ